MAFSVSFAQIINVALKSRSAFFKTFFLFPLCFVVTVVNAQVPQFYEDIAPIIYSKCTQCHRPCEAGAFSLITYNEVFDSALSIQAIVNAGNHFIWPPDTSYKHFINEPFLTAYEISQINDWVSGGMPAGNPNNAPAGPIYANGSFIGDPDTVLTLSQHFTIPGDNLPHYKLFVIPTGFVQQRFIRALEFNPCDITTAHHAFISVDTSGLLAQEDANTPGYGLDVDSVIAINHSTLLTVYHHADRVEQFPEGMGYRIPALADLILQIHYLPSSVPIDDSVSLSVFFDNSSTTQEVHTVAIDENDVIEPPFIIPKNKVETLHQYFESCDAWSLLSISPQMNVIGKSMIVYSVNSSNDTAALISIPSWTSWNSSLYYFPSTVEIASNSIFYSAGTFDNTQNNPENPNDPPLNWTHDCFTIDDDLKVYLQFTGSIDCVIPDSCLFVSGIANEEENFAAFALQPNPAFDQSICSFSISSPCAVSVAIYDLSGRKIKTVLSNEKFGEGIHSLNIKLNNYMAGVYFCSMQAGQFSATKMLIIQK